MGACTRWSLFVDESGNFKDPNDAVAVAGVLLREDAAGASADAIRRSIQGIVPTAPWPLHACLLNKPVMQELWDEAARRSRRDPSREATSKRILAVLEARHPKLLDQCLNDLAAKREPSYELVDRLDAELEERDREDHRLLEARVRAIRAAMARLVEGLLSNHLNEEAGALAPGCLIASGETRHGDAVPEAGSEAGDRYLLLLECLLERVVDVLRRNGRCHRVQLHVLERRVSDPTLGVEAGLHTRHLAQIQGRLGASLADIQIVPWEIPQFDERVHPMLVVADYVANATRRRLERGSLQKVEGNLAQATGLRVRSGSPGASHLAASGEARQLVVTARAGRALGRLEAPEGSRLWAIEQAREWAAILGGAR